jgi:toxin YoeB
MRRRILFEAEAFEDYNEWAKMDRKIYNKIVELIKDIERTAKIWTQWILVKTH